MQMNVQDARRALRAVAQKTDAWGAALGVAPEQLFRLLSDAAGGDTSAYVRAAYEAMEKDDAIGHSIGTRKAAVLACPVIVTPADDSPRAAEIAAGVREIWDGIPRRRARLNDLLDALYIGFSLAQMRWSARPVNGLWRVEALETVPPEALTFRVDNETRDFPLLKTKTPGAPPLDLAPYRADLIFHTREARGSCLYGGLARTLLWFALFRRFSVHEWIQFLEVYGRPFLIGKYPAGTSQADQDTLMTALDSLVGDARAMISEETNISALETQRQSSANAFRDMRKDFGTSITLVVLGQTKTSDGEGGSLALAQVHNEVRWDRVEEDTEALAETLMADFVRPAVARNWGPDETLVPRLQIPFEEPSDRAAEAGVIKQAVDLGLDVGESYAREQLGIPEPEEGENILVPPSGGAAATLPFAGGQRPLAGSRDRSRRTMRGEPWSK